MRKFFLTASAFIVMLISACAPPADSSVSTKQAHPQPQKTQKAPAEKPAVTEAPVKPRDDAVPPVATVNGRDIARRELLQLLLDSHGLVILQQMMFREAVRDAATQQNIVVTPGDIEREYDLTLQAEHLDGKDLQALTPARREQLISDWTRSRAVTREELAIAMERQTILRKLVAPQIKITDEMLQNEFKRAYGEKAEVRHIQLSAQRGWPQLQARLAQGDRFEDLVADFSQNQLTRERRGLMPPFSRDDPTVPSVFISIAFSLQPGQVSNPFEAEKSFHVIKLERIIPAEKVEFDTVKEGLRRKLTRRLEMQGMEEMGRTLLLKAQISIEDRALRKQYEQRLSTGDVFGPPLTH